MRFVYFPAAGLLTILLLGCSHSDQAEARRQEAQAETQVRKAASEVKQEAKAAGRKIDQALQPGNMDNRTAAAGEKLKRGEQRLEEAGGRAAAKLSRAAIIAQVKTKLATDVGLSTTLAEVDVDRTGQIVTLRGTVSNETQRQQAAVAAGQVEGVTRVVNQLRVKN